MTNEFHEIFIAEVREKLFEEFWPRLFQCLDECDKELLWHQPNTNTNSIGNLVLHLEGNVRQWLLHGVDGQPDNRNRPWEFEHGKQLPVDELKNRMNQLRCEIEALLDRIVPWHLTEKRTIQGFYTTVMGALVHVTEHFSYHLGQITLLVKLNKNIDLGYYAGRDID